MSVETIYNTGYFINFDKHNTATAPYKLTENNYYMKKTIFLALLSAMTLLGGQCLADNPFVPTTEGMVLKTVEKDKKGKTTAYTTTVVAEVRQTPEGMQVTTMNTVYNADGKAVSAQIASDMEGGESIDQKTADMLNEQIEKFSTLQTLVTDTEVIIPMTALKDLMEDMTMEGYKLNINMDDNATYPVSPKAGQTMPPVELSLSITVDSKEMEIMSVIIRDRHIVGKETISVPAGTFECWKVSETTDMKTVMGTMTMLSETWYADGIGEVKSVELNKKGKIESSSELLSVTKP